MWTEQEVEVDGQVWTSSSFTPPFAAACLPHLCPLLPLPTPACCLPCTPCCVPMPPLHCPTQPLTCHATPLPTCFCLLPCPYPLPSPLCLPSPTHLPLAHSENSPHFLYNLLPSPISSASLAVASCVFTLPLPFLIACLPCPAHPCPCAFPFTTTHLPGHEPTWAGRKEGGRKEGRKGSILVRQILPLSLSLCYL